MKKDSKKIPKETKKKIQKIKNHFENLSIEQFEENLLKAGIREIKPSGMKIV
jgi:hypothetical protein